METICASAHKFMNVKSVAEIAQNQELIETALALKMDYMTAIRKQAEDLLPDTQFDDVLQLVEIERQKTCRLPEWKRSFLGTNMLLAVIPLVAAQIHPGAGRLVAALNPRIMHVALVGMGLMAGTELGIDLHDAIWEHPAFIQDVGQLMFAAWMKVA